MTTTPTTPAERRKTVLMNLARKLEHLCSLIEEDAECNIACEASALDAAADRAERLMQHVETEINTILASEGEANIG